MQKTEGPTRVALATPQVVQRVLDRVNTIDPASRERAKMLFGVGFVGVVIVFNGLLTFV